MCEISSHIFSKMSILIYCKDFTNKLYYVPTLVNKKERNKYNNILNLPKAILGRVCARDNLSPAQTKLMANFQ